MSANEDDSSNASSSSDESEDITLTGLVATRAKRKTAGNQYVAPENVEQEKVLQAFFADEDEGESDEYQSSAQDDDDAAMDSSSSDDDAGPQKEGEAEDLEGEKELKKAERAEQNRKRKAQQAKMTVPAFAKKKVKLAEDVQADDGGSSAIDTQPKKKPQRKALRISGEDLPTRQSTRASAVAFRETVSVSLQESAERSRKHKTALHETMKRERAARRTDLSLEERLEKCKSIEKETAKELGRFEREEAERVRIREEALMAKRRRAVDGPRIRDFSTSALFADGKVNVPRLQHGSQAIDDILAEQHAKEPEAVEAYDAEPVPIVAESLSMQKHALEAPESAIMGSPMQVEAVPTEKLPPHLDADEGERVVDVMDVPELNDPGQESQIKLELMEDIRAPSTTIDEDSKTTRPIEVPASAGLESNMNGDHDVPPSSATFGARSSHLQQDLRAPIVYEQAQRHTIMLEDFPSLESATRRLKATSVLEPTAVAQLLMPDSYPSFTDDEASYLRKTRKLKQELYPKQVCALTSWEGKYRDPKTGIVFADVPAYKMLQRLIAGGCEWNSMLECWSSPIVGMIGRPAAGVPEGFYTPGTEA